MKQKEESIVWDCREGRNEKLVLMVEITICLGHIELCLKDVGFEYRELELEWRRLSRFRL